MKSIQRIFLLVGLALLLTALVSPWAAAWWNAFAANRSGLEPLVYPFGRIFDRIFMISSIGLFVIFRRYVRLGSLRELALPPSQVAKTNIALGAALAIGSTGLLVVAMTLVGTFTPYFRLDPATALARLGSALFAAVCAATAEEIFFRGILFRGLRDSLGRINGYFLASLIFAAIHFIHPASESVLAKADGWAGLYHLAGSFRSFLNPGAIAPGLIGLFVIGVVLCFALERTGTLYLSIGLHAGWIFALKSIRVFGDFIRQDLGWVFGSSDPKIVSGPATWLGVLLVGFVIARLSWFSSGRTSTNYWCSNRPAPRVARPD